MNAELQRVKRVVEEAGDYPSTPAEQEANLYHELVGKEVDRIIEAAREIGKAANEDMKAILGDIGDRLKMASQETGEL